MIRKCIFALAFVFVLFLGSAPLDASADINMEKVESNVTIPSTGYIQIVPGESESESDTVKDFIEEEVVVSTMPGTQPETGDQTKNTFYFLLLVMSLCGIGYTIREWKKVR